jgi:hypothetical protein
MLQDPVQSNDFRPQPAFPSLEGRHVFLRPVSTGDYAGLQQAEIQGELGMRWRYRGSTPSPEQWAQGLWRTVLAQHLIVRRADDRPIGLVLVYQPDFQDGHAQLAAVRFDLADRSPRMMLGMALFLRHVFACWSFRKLYLEVTEFNYEQFASGAGRLFDVEGRYRDHVYFNGAYWDQLVLAVGRERWQSHGEALLAAEDLEEPAGTTTVTLKLPARPR